MFEDIFFDRLLEQCPPPVVEPENKDSLFTEELPPVQAESTSNAELLEKISALEKMLADMKNTDNGSNIQSTSDL